MKLLGRTMNIRTKMMLLYALIFAVLIVLFGAVFYLNLQNSLQSDIDTELREHALEIANGVHLENGTIVVRDVTGILDSDTTSDNLATPAPTAGGAGGKQPSAVNVDIAPLVRVLASKGSVSFATAAFGTLTLPAISISQPLKNVVWQGTVMAKSGQRVRIYSLPLAEHGIVFAVVQVGQSLTSLDNTLRSIIIELIIIGPFTLLLSFLGSYWLAARSFAPVKKMTSIVQRIKAGDLQERVPVPPSKDELQTLAITFNDMIERLEKDFTRQRRFVADASHELRTPVAAIRSMTDVALKQGDDVPSEEYLTTLRDVNTEAERLGHLINELLALARADENQILLEHEPVRLDLLAADVAATTELLASEKDITLEVLAGTPATVIGDEVRLIQVIMNLVDNAIAYTNPGGKVTLKVERKENNALLIVTDTGIGIEQKHLEHIFERFYRVDAARSRAAGGTGLGLAIVDWIVSAHSGVISVVSEPGKGTTFSVQFPLALQKSYKP